jgi:hypothetical protein
MRGNVLTGLLLVAVAVSACDERLSDLTGPTPNLQLTFQSIQREIFDTRDASGRLACTQCHNAAGSLFAAGLNLTSAESYANLVSVGSRTKPGATRVIPGDPENSYLVHKLEGRPGVTGQRMPLSTGPYLTEGQMLVIKTWIARGARND